MNWDRTRELPDSIRRWAADTTSYLSGIYKDATDGSSDIGFGFYRKEKAQVLDKGDIHWKITGSERTVVGLGSTWDGDPIFQDGSRLVIKLQPSVSSCSGSASAANRQAIDTYTEIQDRGDGDLVSPLLEAAENASWLAQQYSVS